jgi:hypothetical protein
MLPHIESKLGHYLAEFRRKKSKIRQNFLLRKFSGKIKEFRISIYLLFIDFKSVYDSIDREKMCVAMNGLNIPQKLIRLFKMIMSNMKSQIKIQSKFSAFITRVHGKETHWHNFFLI